MRVVAACLNLFVLVGCSDGVFQSQRLVTADVRQYEKAEFGITLKENFSNPYDEREVALNMVLTSPSGKSLLLPCFFDRTHGKSSGWIARFTPQESGKYSYHFECIKNGKESERSASQSFLAIPSHKDGFLHIHDFWTLRFDSGKLFRGIGENIGWEPRSFSNPKWTYDYLLPRLSASGANFFRSWMAPNNFPLEWKTVTNTKRYTNTQEYFNPSGIKRLDEVVELADSLGLYMMLAFDSHNTLIKASQWEINNYNVKNGGPASTPEEFFTLRESRERYKNRLRYIVARWGYSTSIGAWEFFNEIDNAAYSREDSVIISHEAIADWHREMAAYLKRIDPYDHIVTTSISHRQIKGLYDMDDLDLNQIHIYKQTSRIPERIRRFNSRYNKPFAVGEFAYEWDWNKDFTVIGDKMDFDYKRGLWYGLFSPTPILPMSWWWEYFDERGMTPYFRRVRTISDMMLDAGKGSFEPVDVKTQIVESYGVKCGASYFVYLVNTDKHQRTTNIWIDGPSPDATTTVAIYDPSQGAFTNHEQYSEDGNGIRIEGINLGAGEERIVVVR
jgi:hypothetical protein